MAEQTVTIPTSDGRTLTGTLFEPDLCDSKSSSTEHTSTKFPTAILLSGATGIPHRYYRPFALWAANETKSPVLTYDYWDFAESSVSASTRRSPATMAQWGIDDQSAALDYLISRYPDANINAIGHSLGALFWNFHPNATRITSAVAVASGPAYWRHHPMHYTLQVTLFWWVLGPTLTALLGYLPGKIIGLGADVPSGVYWQWRRWCTNLNFHQPDWGHRVPQPDPTRLQGKLRTVAITDDVFIIPTNVRRITQFYPAAQATHHQIAPQDIGVEKIGHHAVFARKHADAWPQLLPA